MSNRWTIRCIPTRLWLKLWHRVPLSWREVFTLRVDVPERTNADRERTKEAVHAELERRRQHPVSEGSGT